MKLKLGSLFVVGVLLVGLSGCSHGPDEQTAELNKMLNILDLESISKIVCDYTYEPGFNPDGNPHERTIDLAGTNHRAEAIERLKKAGFTVTDELDGHARLSGPGGMEASVVPSTPDRAGTDIRYDSRYTCSVPAEGMTDVSLTLR